METKIRTFEIHVYTADCNVDTYIATEWEVTPLRVLIIQNTERLISMYNTDGWNKIIMGKEVDANS